MNSIGLDIGGANIKVAFSDEQAQSFPFPLWRHHQGLKDKLAEILHDFDGRLLVTMTGELADCFPTKKLGVEFIVDAVGELAGGRAHFYQTTGEFVDAGSAKQEWQKTAASNWHALAKFVSRFAPNETGTLFDIGSTTTDIIPIHRGVVSSSCRTDLDRLQSGQLVYTGVTRSSLCGIRRLVEIGGTETGVANEVFATTLDANLVLGNVSESDEATFTADGRPATIANAKSRLARTVCCDPEEIGGETIHDIARQFIDAQITFIKSSLKKVCAAFPTETRTFIVSGEGGWLAKQIVSERKEECEVIELERQISSTVSSCAAAYAVRSLALAMKN